MQTKITIWLCSFKRASFFVRFGWPFLRPGLRTEGRCAQGLSRRAFRPPRSGLVLMAPSTAPCLRQTGHSKLRRRFPGSWKINRRSARTQFCSCQRSRYLPRSFDKFELRAANPSTADASKAEQRIRPLVRIAHEMPPFAYTRKESYSLAHASRGVFQEPARVKPLLIAMGLVKINIREKRP